MKNIAIVGGGIAGSCVAYHCLKLGMKSTIFDAATPEKSTTWASGGMIAPLAEVLTGGLLDLGLESKKYYPDFLQELQRDSGLDIPCTQGVLVPTQPRHTRAYLESYFKKRARHDPQVSFIQETNETAGEKLIGVDTAAWVKDEVSLDPRVLVSALHAAIIKLSGSIHWESPIDSLPQLQDTGLYSQIILCPGIGAPDIDGVNWNKLGRFSQDRGIMLRLEDVAPPDVVLYDHQLDGTCYIIPQANGVRIGSTSNPNDNRIDADDREVAQLIHQASRLWPVSLEHLVEVSVGFRPIGPSLTGEPFVGPLDKKKSIWAMLGLHRNGIMFAPYFSDRLSRTLAALPLE